MTLILGLADPANREIYLKTYPLSEINFSGINKTHLFRYIYVKEILELKSIEQW